MRRRKLLLKKKKKKSNYYLTAQLQLPVQAKQRLVLGNTDVQQPVVLLIVKQSVVSEPRSRSSAGFDLKTASEKALLVFFLPSKCRNLFALGSRQAGMPRQPPFSSLLVCLPKIQMGRLVVGTDLRGGEGRGFGGREGGRGEEGDLG